MTSLSRIREYSLVYLASPYSKYPGGLIRAFTDVCALAGALVRLGLPIYSPIAHTHPIAFHGGLDPLDHKLWLNFDDAMMQKSDCLLVAKMESWGESVGIRHEISSFEWHCKPVYYMDPDTLEIDAPH